MTIKLNSETEMVGYLKSLGTECRFISMVTETEVKMRKTANPFLVNGGKVTKRSRRNGLVNVNFVGAVERRLAEALGLKASEVTYEAGETWYVHVMTDENKPMALCVDKKTGAKYYLQYFPHKSYETKYYHNDKEMTPAEVQTMKTFEPTRTESEYKPKVITLAMASIRTLKFRKIEVRQTQPKPDNRLADYANVGVGIGQGQTVEA